MLRHLYFGLRNPDHPPSHTSRSSTPSYDEPGIIQAPRFEEPFDYDANSMQPNMEIPTFADSQDSYPETDRLSTGPYFTDPISRSPSPLYAALSPTQSITLDSWARRYEIHNEAFIALSNNLLALSEGFDPAYLRYIVTPLAVLGILSRPNSHERGLYLKIADRLKRHISEVGLSEPTDPIGSAPLEFDLPWDKLDAF